ncbi:hypothetical protein TRAPUB_5954, partial [Trametes pubescens]
WSRYWPIPLFGTAYLLHTRLRRYSPRKLPPLTSLRPAGVYVTTTAYMLWLSECVHITQEANRDRDMYTILVSVRALRLQLAPAMEKFRGSDELKHTRTYDALAPTPQASLLAKLAWRYNCTAESDPLAFNMAMATVMGVAMTHLGAEKLRRVPREDVDALIILLANDIVNADAEKAAAAESSFDGTERRCLIGLGVITPFAMLARWTRRRYLLHPLNLVQRLLLYGAIFPDVVTAHRRMHYATTIRDKHRVAELCKEMLPKLDGLVDEMMQKGVAIVTL